ncbi:uncharacterized protein LOC121405658 isoform X1 [Lytechinus variegatus]|uniref:uncharacterized protein LOC121405658 isoform X1 n=1 Tax=Lytechinus variegatus TaxID=7654 RepID=UPI001BB27B0E|nr:uncharacterized protein LOC121405658 isoform X1 [Lytechinus variegatus]XP_041452489.1 uncharacterized protein LOC121405658 isoform X1 [Lytechinus variegatus]
MYVPEGGGVEGGDREVLHQVVILLTSAASLVVLVLASFVCGMCYCFGGSKPDYDDDDVVSTGFRSSDQEQKWPILNRSASLGAKNSGRSQSPVFVHQSSLRPLSESDDSVANDEESIATYGTMDNSSIATKTTVEAHVELADRSAQTSFEKQSQADEKSATLPPDLSNKRSDTPKKSVMFRSVSVDPSLIPLQNFVQDVGSMHSEPVQPATKPGILHNVHSEPTMPLPSEYVHVTVFYYFRGCGVLRDDRETCFGMHTLKTNQPKMTS